VAEAIYDAIKDDEVEAIILRVSSPGGSDTASDQILAAVMAAKKAGKPVVVSMGAYAASGGYWIASKASAIVAQPSTLTGSIGVFGGKFAVGPALQRFGVNLEGVEVGGAYTGAFDVDEPFDPAQRAEFAQWMDRIYNGFVLRVAEGRKLSPERVDELARGRVWTGAQAKGLGLVDELGGFYQAVDTAKRLAKIDADAEVTLRRIPGETGFFEALGEVFGVSAASAAPSPPPPGCWATRALRRSWTNWSKPACAPAGPRSWKAPASTDRRRTLAPACRSHARRRFTRPTSGCADACGLPREEARPQSGRGEARLKPGAIIPFLWHARRVRLPLHRSAGEDRITEPGARVLNRAAQRKRGGP
jgi:signal peptide peptidase SppA